MVKKVVHICDHCDSVIRTDHGGVAVSMRLFVTGTKRTYDLCDACANMVELWVKTKDAS